MSYIIGLWFTLRTHAAVIWNTEVEEKKAQVASSLPNGSISHQQTAGGPPASAPKHQNSGHSESTIRETQLYKRILGQSLKQAGLSPTGAEESHRQASTDGASKGQSPQTPYIVPPKSSGGESNLTDGNSSQHNLQIAGLSNEDNNNLVRQVAEMAATAAAVAARDATKGPRKVSVTSHSAPHNTPRAAAPPHGPGDDHDETVLADAGHGAGGGHDAPNWSRLKSTIILLGATFLYAIIAEILVNTVDVVLESVDIDEKFLGITLFALVPNTTEFLVKHILRRGTMLETDFWVKPAECHIVCNEREHSSLNGDWLSLCAAGLLAANSCPRSIQRCAWTLC